MKNVLLDKGIILPSGEISKDKVNLVTGAITQPFAEMVRLVFRPDTKAVQRWMVLPICRGSDIHGENV